MKKILIMIFLIGESIDSYAYETIQKAVIDFKTVTHAQKSEENKIKSAQIVQEAMNLFFKEHSDAVVAMIKRYYTIFGDSPFVVAFEDPRLAKAYEAIQTLDRRVQELERTNEALQQTLHELHNGGIEYDGLEISKLLPKTTKEKNTVVTLLPHVYDHQTVQEAQQDFKAVVSASHDHEAKQQASFIIREAMEKFFVKNSNILTQMIGHYFAVFGESPFREEGGEDPRIHELESLYHQAFNEMKQLQLELQGLEVMLENEKNNSELLKHELLAVTLTQDGSEEERGAHSIAQLYKQLKDAFAQYEQEFGFFEQQDELLNTDEVVGHIEKQEVALKTMISQWDIVMRQLRLLTEKAEMYEKMEKNYELYGIELKKTTEQRDLLERQLSDLHRKFDAEQTRSSVALNDARSQVEAVRNQLAEVKNQLALAKKQQQQQVPKHQENEKLLQAERMAYEGALSDERMQRQKLRQQVQELQKRLDNERTMYEKRILSLEKEVVMLIERLPAAQRSGLRA